MKVGFALRHLSTSLTRLKWSVWIVLEAIRIVLSGAALLAGLVLIVCHDLAPRGVTQRTCVYFGCRPEGAAPITFVLADKMRE